MMRWFIVIPLLAIAVLPTASTHAAGSCSAYPVDGGCAGANPRSAFIDTGFARESRQSGQSWDGGDHPQNFNMAGVDYPVGAIGGTVWKDPAVNPPAGCAYKAVAAGGVDTLSCGGQVDINMIAGYDFTGATGSHNPAVIVLGVNAATPTGCIHNNLFLEPGATTVITSVHPTHPLCIKFNTFTNLLGAGSSGFMLVRHDSVSTATLDIEYNAFLNWGGARIYGGRAGNASRTFKYNYISGLALCTQAGGACPGTHGEIDLYGGQGGPYEVNTIDWEFNTYVLPQTPNPTAITSIFFAATGTAAGYVVDNFIMNGNTVVTNKAATGAANVGYAALRVGWAQIKNFTYTNNYVDATGTNSGCQRNGSASAPSVTASTNGNQITITAWGRGIGAIDVGYQINHEDFTQATITSLVSGAPGHLPVTYAFDGPPQSVDSDSHWDLRPALLNATISGNYNLVSGDGYSPKLPDLSGC